MLGIVLLGQVRRNSQHLHRHDVEALLFEARNHLAHQAALDTIGLEQNEGSFHRELRVLSCVLLVINSRDSTSRRETVDFT